MCSFEFFSQVNFNKVRVKFFITGPGLSFGDPILNKYNKFRFVLPCVRKGNCPKPEDEAYLDWKSLKQVFEKKIS